MDSKNSYRDKKGELPTSIPVFLCYRRVDGSEASQKVFELLKNSTINIENINDIPVDVFFDLNLSAVSNWKEHHGPALERSRAFIVVLTPGLAANLSDKDNPDWVHMELKWWLKNRQNIAPIFIDCTGQGFRFLPNFVRDKWQDSNFLSLNIDDINAMSTEDATREYETLKNRILNGIREREGLIRYHDIERLKSLLRKTRAAVFGITSLTILLVLSVFWLRIALDSSKRTKIDAINQRWAAESANSFEEDPERSLNLISHTLKNSSSNTASLNKAIETSLFQLGRSGGVPYELIETGLATQISPNGKQLAVGGLGGSLILYDLESADSIIVFEKYDFNQIDTDEENQTPIQITWLQYSPNGDYLFVSNTRGRYVDKFWAIDLHQNSSYIKKHVINDISAISMDPKGRWLIVGKDSGNVALYDLSSDKPFQEYFSNISGHNAEVSVLEWDKNGNWFSSGTVSGELRLWLVDDNGISLSKSLNYDHPEGEIGAIEISENEEGNPFEILLFTGTGYKRSKNGGGFGRNEAMLRTWRIDIHDFTGTTNYERLPDPVTKKETRFLQITKIISQPELKKVTVAGYRGQSPNYGEWYQKKGVERFAWGISEDKYLFDDDSDPLKELKIDASGNVEIYDACLVGESSWTAFAIVGGGVEISDSYGNTYMLYGHEGNVRSINNWKKGIITTGDDHRARIWDLSGSKVGIGKALPELSSKWSNWTAEKFSFSDDNSKLLIQHSYGSRMTWWDLDSAGASKAFYSSGFQYFSSYAGFDGIIGNSSYDANSIIWPLSEPDSSYNINGDILDLNTDHNLVLVSSSNGVKIHEIDKNGKIIDSTDSNNTLQNDESKQGIIIDNATVITLKRTTVCKNSPDCDTFSSDETTIATDIKVYNKVDNSWSLHKAFSPPYDISYFDKKWLVLNKQDSRSPEGGQVWKMDESTFEEPHYSFNSELESIGNAQIFDNRWLVFGNWRDNKYLRFEDEAKGRVLKIFDLDNARFITRDVKFNQDPRAIKYYNEKLYVSTEGGRIWIVNFENGNISPEPLLINDLSLTGVNEFTISEIGGKLATGDANGVIKIWDLENLKIPPISIANDFSAEIDILSFSNNGKWLAVSATDESPRLYNLDKEVLSKAAQVLASKEFSQEERRWYGIEKD